MTVGGVLNEAFEYYTRFFRRFFLTAAAVFCVLDLLSAIAADAQGKARGLAVAWGIVATVAALVGSFWVQGALLLAVDQARHGRVDSSVEDLYRRTRPVLGMLLAAGVLVGVVCGLAFFLLVVPGIFLLTRWSLTAPVIVLERRRTLDALRRSSRLVAGHGWTVFGILALTTLLELVATVALTTIFSFLPRFGAVWLGGLIAHSIVVPFAAISWTVTYLELRRREQPSAHPLAA